VEKLHKSVEEEARVGVEAVVTGETREIMKIKVNKEKARNGARKSQICSLIMMVPIVLKSFKRDSPDLVMPWKLRKQELNRLLYKLIVTLTRMLMIWTSAA
jgi:hypothetical protein